MALVQKYVSSTAPGGGDGDTEATAYTLAEALAAIAADHCYNIKVGTYVIANNTDMVLSVPGSDAAPIWLRGYEATPGDLEIKGGGYIPTKPLIQLQGTGRLTVSGANYVLSGLDIRGARSNASAMLVSGGNLRMVRCRVENTAVNANASALQTSSSANNTFHACLFRATATAARVVANGTNASFDQCVFRGGQNGLDVTTNSAGVVCCIFDGQQANAVEASGSGALLLDNCTIHDPGGDGLRFATTATGMAIVDRCIFSACGGYAIRSMTADLTGMVRGSHNLLHGCAIDFTKIHPDEFLYTLTDAESPFEDASTGDFRLKSTSAGKGAGGVQFEGEEFWTYPDVGAVHREERVIVRVRHRPMMFGV